MCRDERMFVTGMTNAEVLHQVEHGYRMQAPQVGVSIFLDFNFVHIWPYITVKITV